VQVSDLGLARVLPFSATLESSTPSLIGPVQWMSPEAHRGEFSRAADVYMFGATLLELVTRRDATGCKLAIESGEWAGGLRQDAAAATQPCVRRRCGR